MISFFKGANQVFALATKEPISPENCEKLQWLFGDAEQLNSKAVEGLFVGPRKEMITPWSTNAVEIIQNMDVKGIARIEEYFAFDEEARSISSGLLIPNFQDLESYFFVALP